MRINFPGSCHRYPVAIDKGKTLELDCCQAYEVDGQVIHEVSCSNNKIKVDPAHEPAWD